MALVGLALLGHVPTNGTTSSVIVQARDLAAASDAVRAVGGTVTHELDIINAVGARLTRAQATALRNRGLKLFASS